MKVVLFCGGLGTRIREYSESIPKPMVPVGHQPILWHVMQYYSQYGHDDFILCLGYKANVIKDYFLNNRQTANSDCVVSEFGKKVEILGDRPPDWRVSLVDTGTWRNIGERLMAVKHLVKDEEIFLANYSDGLTDAPLPEMIERFKESGKIACFIAIHPPISFHLAEFDGRGIGQPDPLQPGIRHLDQRRLLHLPQRDLRLHQGWRGTRARAVQPPDRGRPPHGLQVRRLLARDGHAARPSGAGRHGRARRDAVARAVAAEQSRPRDEGAASLPRPGDRLSVLCLGAHSDDIEIGAGAMLLGLMERGIKLDVHWCVLSGGGVRDDEARKSAADFLAEAASARDRGQVVSRRLLSRAGRGDQAVV